MIITSQKLTITICLVLGVLAALGAYWWGTRQTPAPVVTTPIVSTRNKVIAQTTVAARALYTKNGAQLAALVHPIKGVRFSLYGYVNVTHDKLFMPAQITQYFNTPIKFTWGEQDGSGTPIIIPMKQFISAEFADHDYEHAVEILYDTYKGQGNSLNNMAALYPNAHIVQFYFPGFNATYGGMDWRAIRVAVEEYQGQWYVVGLMSDKWTI